MFVSKTCFSRCDRALDGGIAAKPNPKLKSTPQGLQIKVKSIQRLRHPKRLAHAFVALQTSNSDGGGVQATQALPETGSKNVVVAVDSSEDSIAAFTYALTHLYRPGDVMHILHVVAENYSSPASGSVFYAHNSWDPDVDHSLEEAAEEFIKAEFLSVAEKRGVDVKVVLVREHSRRAAVGRAVCRAAEELGADPLVLATHHKNYFEEMLLGSVSKYCAKHCNRPVLLVHPSHSQFGDELEES